MNMSSFKQHHERRALAFLLVVTSVLGGCNALAEWDELPESAAGATTSNLTARVTLPVTSAEHSCAIVGVEADAKAMCWGRNEKGKLGTGDTKSQLTPTAVVGLRDVKSIEAGLLHSCAVDGSGSAWCWGANKYAALGRGTLDEDPHPTPERITGMRGFERVHCGMDFTCAETSAKTVACWGTNNFGQRGDGTLERTNVPRPIPSLKGVESLSTGSQHACAVVTSEAAERVVYCWGRNDRGQLGQPPSTEIPIKVPTLVPDLVGVAKVFTGDTHTCAILESGAVKCWGANDKGQLGSAPSADQPIPTAVPSLSGVESLALGAEHTCAQKKSKLYCWGSNARGQLGAKPAVVSQETKPRLIRVDGLFEQSAGVSARGDHTCAVRPDGALFCWGSNEDGQLGNGTTTPMSSPTLVRFGSEQVER